MKKYNLLYWQHYSSAFEVDAESFEDAVCKLRKQFGKSEMAKIEDLEFDDDGVELIGAEGDSKDDGTEWFASGK